MADVDRPTEETQDTENQSKSRSKPRKEFSGVREYGKSILPVSRVQKILKADKELPMVSKEAVFILSASAEEFIKQWVLSASKQAEREKRTTSTMKDLKAVVKRGDEYYFIEDLITTLPDRDVEPRRPRKKAQDKQVDLATRTDTLTAFMTKAQGDKA